MSHVTISPPRLQYKNYATRVPPRVSRSSGHQLQSKTHVPPEKRGEKMRKKMGTKSWVLNRTAKRGSQNWVDFFKKKRISHYVFACFVQLGSKFGVLLSTRQHIHIYIYMNFQAFSMLSTAALKRFSIKWLDCPSSQKNHIAFQEGWERVLGIMVGSA